MWTGRDCCCPPEPLQELQLRSRECQSASVATISEGGGCPVRKRASPQACQSVASPQAATPKGGVSSGELHLSPSASCNSEGRVPFRSVACSRLERTRDAAYSLSCPLTYLLTHVCVAISRRRLTMVDYVRPQLPPHLELRWCVAAKPISPHLRLGDSAGPDSGWCAVRGCALRVGSPEA